MKNENKIKFVHKHNQQLDIKVVSPDLPLYELLDAFKEFALSIGYHPNTVAKVKFEDNDEEIN